MDWRNELKFLFKNDVGIKKILYSLLAVGVVIGGFFVFKEARIKYIDYREGIRAEEFARTEKELASQEADRLRDEELAALRQEIIELKNKPVETKTVTVEAKDTVASMVKEWNTKVAHIECTWVDKLGRTYAKASGSATIMKSGDGIRAVTNRHVLLDSYGYGPHDCSFAIAGYESFNVVNDFKTNFYVGTEEDWGFIKLASSEDLNKITKNNLKICTDVDAGDRLLVLGYPSIGSQSGLTVTEGIVSGSDGSYFITSAKIDKGNSGGAAVLVKDNCYLGIPSASVVGSIESLGRILMAKFVTES